MPWPAVRRFDARAPRVSLHVYANTARRFLSETLDGGAMDLPELVAGGELLLALRFSARLDGVNFLRDLDVVDAYAAAGSLDARPTGGSFKLKLGEAASEAGVNLTTAISEITAANLAAAINALSGKPATVTVTEENGSFLVVFPDIGDQVIFSLEENELEPASLLRVSSYEAGNEWRYIFRFIQTPAAFASAWERRVSAPPSFVREVTGGTLDGVETNEIQVLVIPPDFLGVFQIIRDNVRTVPLSRLDGAAAIAAALEPLADVGGRFSVTIPPGGEAWIEFTGEMGGVAQDLLTVDVPRAPAGDVILALDLSHPEFFHLLAEEDEVEIPVHVRVIYRDEVDENVTHTCDWLALGTAKRGLHWDGLTVAPGVDWLKPPRESFVPVPVGAIVTGSQHLEQNFPEAGDVGADEFTFAHDLGTNHGHWTLTMNAAPGVALVPGFDYRITGSAEDSFVVKLLPGGFVFGDPVVNAGNSTLFNLAGNATVAAEGALNVTFSTAGPRDAIAVHTQAMATVDDLVETLENAFGRIRTLERSVGTANVGAIAAGEDAVEIVRPLNPFFAARRAKIVPGFVPPASLFGFDAGANGLAARSLPPAVHDAVVETLPTPFPDASDDYLGRVFQTETARDDSPAGPLRVDDFVACDGVRWYRVEQTIAGADSYYPAEMEMVFFKEAVSASVFTLRSDLSLLVGFQAVLQPSTRRPRDKETEGRFRLLLEWGAPVAATTPGTPGANLESITWSTMLVADLFLTPTPDIHRFGLTLSRRLADGDALSAAGAEATDVLTAAAHGLANGDPVRVAETAGGLTAATTYFVRDKTTDTFKLSNESDLSDLVDLTEDATHSVTPEDVDTITGAVRFGRIESEPESLPYAGAGGSDFFLRARLVAWDIADTAPEPAGLVMVSGLNFGWDGQPDSTAGRLTISA